MAWIAQTFTGKEINWWKRLMKHLCRQMQRHRYMLENGIPDGKTEACLWTDTWNGWSSLAGTVHCLTDHGYVVVGQICLSGESALTPDYGYFYDHGNETLIVDICELRNRVTSKEHPDIPYFIPSGIQYDWFEAKCTKNETKTRCA